MVKNQVTAVFVLFSLVFMTVTSGRYFQETDDSGRRKKRSLDTVFEDLNDNEKLTLLDILMSRDAEQLS